MTNPFLGQIQAFAFNFPPKGWVQCSGQIMPISQNQALYSLLGTVYGGDGVTTFALPNLQGRFPLGMSSQFSIGTLAGESAHTLTVNETPIHIHPMVGSGNQPSAGTPVSNFPAADSAVAMYGAAPDTTLGSGSSLNAGGQPHPNMPPYLVMGFYIALQGIFPTRN